MKWMLLVLIYGTIPVKTGLVFDTIDECLKAEEQMRGEYARVYNAWRSWAEANPKESQYPDSQKFNWRRDGMETTGTCIPHAKAPPLRTEADIWTISAASVRANPDAGPWPVRFKGHIWPPRPILTSLGQSEREASCKSSFAITMSIRPSGR